MTNHRGGSSGPPSPVLEKVWKPRLFEPSHVSDWWKPSWISVRVLKEPVWIDERLERGALILNNVDPLVGFFPDLRALYILIERHGWFGPNASGYADIALVEDLSVKSALMKHNPDIIHLPLGGADFVDDLVFAPLATEPIYDVIQVSCWSRRKRIELFIEAAARLPQVSFLHLGHFENNGSADELQYRKECIDLAARSGANMTFPFAQADSNDALPRLKDQMNVWINRARIGVLTAAPEGINRFKMECMAADRPMLVAADAGTPTTKHINPSTGLLYEPDPDALALAIRTALDHRDRFQPRTYILESTGRRRSVGQLKEALRESCGRTGSRFHFDDIDWDGRNESLAWGKDGLSIIADCLARNGRPVGPEVVDRVFSTESMTEIRPC
ncbi:MAG TPA: glycosyltransferase [Opitutaceae bacterium]|jgi:glycosyltransferase involved in cell wall biosynthesis